MSRRLDKVNGSFFKVNGSFFKVIGIYKSDIPLVIEHIYFKDANK
jgi:hypothetical protein